MRGGEFLSDKIMNVLPDVTAVRKHKCRTKRMRMKNGILLLRANII